MSKSIELGGATRTSGRVSVERVQRWRDYLTFMGGMERFDLQSVMMIAAASPLPPKKAAASWLGLLDRTRGGSPSFWIRQAGSRMDREMIIDHLAQAERHVAEGTVHVERQRLLVEQL